MPEKKEILVCGYIQKPDTFISDVIYNKLTNENISVKQKIKNSIDSTIIALKKMNIKTGQTVTIAKDTTNIPGKYTFSAERNNDYLIEITDKKYLKNKISFNTKNLSDSEKIILDTVNLEQIPSKPIVFHNIYFEFNKFNLTQNSKVIIDTTLLEVMQEYPQIIVEIGAHTDAKGNDNYNLELSQKRAESVVNYLIDKGISPKNLIPKGYGETIPMAPEITPEGIDLPEGREKNRRVEFKLIGIIK